jgi:hypothetical protein
MPGWSPSAADLETANPGRVYESDDPYVAGWIQSAVLEIVAEVGDFDDTIVINPSAAVADQVTVGDLAREAASLRAAYLAERRNPEQSTGGLEGYTTGIGAELYARYVEALARLKGWARSVNGRRRSTPYVTSVPLRRAQPVIYGDTVW